MRKKLIEVALPLDAINRESVREGYIYRANPSAVHKWWAQRPLAASRAVLFASLVDDPDQDGVPDELLQLIDRLPVPKRSLSVWRQLSLGDQRRERLFWFMERLVKWEGGSDQSVIAAARDLIRAATEAIPRQLPIRSVAADRYPWRRSALGCPHTLVTSTRSPC